jgi:general secretion pathway protein C
LQAKWLSNSSDIPRRASEALENAVRSLSQPARARRLRQGLGVLFALWCVFALSRLIWALLPAGDATLPADADIINPVGLPAAAGSNSPVNIVRLQGWHLFGEAGAPDPAAQVPEIETAAASARDGIEKGARETRLALKLRGVVASTEDGLGHAVIEHKSKQETYAVEDKLPLSGRVTLAKVMPRQVVLDNGGTYELLELFEDSPLDSQLVLQPPPEALPSAGRSRSPQATGPGADASAVGRNYRERLYQNPQALVDVVSVSAVRENGELRGYRIAPGKEQAQFELLGFRSGDLVTSVNGIELNDPANTIRLYQTMRSAGEAVFELQRDNQPVTVSVNLGEGREP